MKSKIIATIMALGMVLTAFAITASAAEPEQPIILAPGQTHSGRVNGTGGQAFTTWGVDGLPNTVDDRANGIFWNWLVARAWANPTVALVGGGNAADTIVGAMDIVPNPGGWRNRSELGTPWPCSFAGDCGNAWTAWTAGEWCLLVGELRYTNSTDGNNYTFADYARLPAGLTNHGFNHYLRQIPAPEVVAKYPGNTTAILRIPSIAEPTDTRSCTRLNRTNLLAGYAIYKSASAITTANLGAFSSMTNQGHVGGYWYYKDTAWNPAGTYYASRPYFDVQPFSGVPMIETNHYTYGYSDYVRVENLVATDYAPEASGLAATAYTGSLATESITFTATVTDTDATPDVVTGARIMINGLGPFAMDAVDGTFDETSEPVTYTWSLPNGMGAGSAFTWTSPEDFTVAGQDAVEGWNATVTASTFGWTDTTNPTVAYTGLTPADLSTKAVGAMFVIDISYADYTNFTAFPTSYVEYQVNAGAWTQIAPTMNTFAWGSYLVGLRATFTPAAVVGNTVTFRASIDDIGGGAPVSLLARTVTITAAGSNQVDRYPIWGRVELYNGVAGAYSPIYPAAATNIQVTYWNDSLAIPGWDTNIIATDPSGFYTFDLYATTDLTNVYLYVPSFSAAYPNVGYNWTTVDNTTFPMGRLQNIVCGIPYDVIWGVPAPPLTIPASTLFNVNYRIVDVGGVIAQGYYSFAADGWMRWISSDVAATLPVPVQFTGIGGLNGQATVPITLMTLGNQWINVTETDNVNPYLTPWGAIQYRTQPLGLVNNYFEDWENITILVTGGGFDWRLTDGWNLVSSPQNALRRAGVNAFFDAEDAIAECVIDMAAHVPPYNDANIKIATKNNAVTPSTYTTYTRGDLETPLTFAMTAWDGFWVYVTLGTMGAGNSMIVHFDALNWVNVTGTIDHALDQGWNLIGHPHDQSSVDWSAGLTASDFTTAVVDANLVVPAQQALVIATYWFQDTQWYQSYVRSATFPGIVARDWGWDAYNIGSNPGNGCWLWVQTACTVNYNVVAVY